YLVWGMNPFGYHLTNLLLHAANAALFFLLALRLLRLGTTAVMEPHLRLGAAAAALFFALHPLRVESVAWVTERRDVLSGLFFLLALLTYLRAVEAQATRRRWLAGSIALYALALLAKSSVMTLPFVLVLLDFYPLRRLAGRWRDWIARPAWPLWAEKIPYLLLAIAGALIALYVKRFELTPFDAYPLSTRVPVALYSLWFYVWKTLLPLGLAPMYMLPARVNPLDLPFVVSTVAVTGITAALLLLRRTWPAGLAVWAYYGIILAPALGIVHAGHQITNDRYSYLACLGWALLAGAAVCVVLSARQSGALGRWWARAAAGAAVVWLVGFAALTWQQIQVWRDTDTLWRHTLEFEPECAVCHSQLGVVLYNQGIALSNQSHLELALEYFHRALALRPDYVGFHHNLALALTGLGRLPEAIENFRRVIEKYPDKAYARNNLAVALIRQGRLQEAVEQLRYAARLAPDNHEVYSNLGTALTEAGKPEEALAHYRHAIELKPDAPQPRFGLAHAQLLLGNPASAQEQYEVLKRLDTRLASMLSPLVNR
ncbi:MAG: tetratricopeptide repeat protein, partial [Candidatus Rokubacteria bacterium]|nr:tetratricopeptide repeat protein [Candidatus Rokubacteria bacterium]